MGPLLWRVLDWAGYEAALTLLRNVHRTAVAVCLSALIPYAAAYAAFNAGVVAFTRSLAVDVAQHGIRVNAIAPDLAARRQRPNSCWAAATPS